MWRRWQGSNLISAAWPAHSSAMYKHKIMVLAALCATYRYRVRIYCYTRFNNVCSGSSKIGRPIYQPQYAALKVCVHEENNLEYSRYCGLYSKLLWQLERIIRRYLKILIVLLPSRVPVVEMPQRELPTKEPPTPPSMLTFADEWTETAVSHKTLPLSSIIRSWLVFSWVSLIHVRMTVLRFGSLPPRDWRT
jgi:hypothetical protein